MSNVFDVYPVYSLSDPNLIVDVEVLDDDRVELLDRAMFAAVKQRGADPLDTTSGVQWAQAVLGEVTTTSIMRQVEAEVAKEGPGVQVTFDTITDTSGRQTMQFAISLTNAT